MRTVIIQSTPATIITHADADVRQARRSDQYIENKVIELRKCVLVFKVDLNI